MNSVNHFWKFSTV